MSLREPGWYWVKVDDTADWQPLEWAADHEALQWYWLVPTMSGVERWQDDEVHEAREGRLPTPDD